MHNVQHRCSDVRAAPFAQSMYRSPSEELTTGFEKSIQQQQQQTGSHQSTLTQSKAVVEAIDPHKVHRLVSYLGDDRSDTTLSYLPLGWTK
jgi:hypothetical protein